MSRMQTRALDDFSPEEFELARRLFSRGHGVQAISVRLERSSLAVAEWVRDVERGPVQRRMAEPWEIECARRMRAEGVSTHAIAREMRRSPGTVAYWVRDLPKPVRGGSGVSDRRKREQRERQVARNEAQEGKRLLALELYQAGQLSRGAIGRQVGADVSTVTKWVVAAGLELRTLTSRRRPA
ncbi:hypothetical protein [Streptomyces sp. NPDC054838]